MTDSTDTPDATSELPPTPPEAPQSAAPMVSPFVPVYKAPWINPAKRTNAIVSAVVAALVLLGAGFVVGIHVGRHDHRGGPRIERGGYGFIPANGPVLRRDGVLYGGGPGQKAVRPGKNIPRQGTNSGAPMPMPSPTST